MDARGVLKSYLDYLYGQFKYKVYVANEVEVFS